MKEPMPHTTKTWAGKLGAWHVQRCTCRVDGGVRVAAMRKYLQGVEIEKVYLCSPSVHVEAGQLLVAGQARVFAVVVGRGSGGLHVEALVREALLIVGLVGLRRGGQGALGLCGRAALELWPRSLILGGKLRLGAWRHIGADWRLPALPRLRHDQDKARQTVQQSAECQTCRATERAKERTEGTVTSGAQPCWGGRRAMERVQGDGVSLAPSVTDQPPFWLDSYQMPVMTPRSPLDAGRRQPVACWRVTAVVYSITTAQRNVHDCCHEQTWCRRRIATLTCLVSAPVLVSCFFSLAHVWVDGAGLRWGLPSLRNVRARSSLAASTASNTATAAPVVCVRCPLSACLTVLPFFRLDFLRLPCERDCSPAITHPCHAITSNQASRTCCDLLHALNAHNRAASLFQHSFPCAPCSTHCCARLVRLYLALFCRDPRGPLRQAHPSLAHVSHTPLTRLSLTSLARLSHVPHTRQYRARLIPTTATARPAHGEGADGLHDGA